MCSQAQLVANRQNAQKSTGPRTTQGKARSAQNATTRGLTAQIPPEQNEPDSTLHDSASSWSQASESATFQTFYDEIEESLQPRSAIERTLAHRIIHLMWRLRRIPDAESELLNKANQQHRAAIEETKGSQKNNLNNC